MNKFATRFVSLQIASVTDVKSGIILHYCEKNRNLDIKQYTTTFSLAHFFRARCARLWSWRKEKCLWDGVATSLYELMVTKYEINPDENFSTVLNLQQSQKWSDNQYIESFSSSYRFMIPYQGAIPFPLAQPTALFSSLRSAQAHLPTLVFM